MAVIDDENNPLTGLSKRILLIENPKAGKGNSSLEEFKVLAVAQGFLLEIRELESSVIVDTLVSDAGSFDYVVAAGGDGTVCSVAHALKDFDVPVLAFPAGTANLIAQNLKIPDDARKVMEILLKENYTELDIPVLETKDSKTGFIVAAGAGADARMIRESENLKEKMGVWAYLAGALKQINPVKTKFILEMDDRTVETEGISVLAANMGMVNFRIPIAGGIDPADGKLNIIVLKADNALSILPNIIDSLRLWLGDNSVDYEKHLEIYTCRSATIHSDPPVPIQYDGELVEHKTPFKVGIMPGKTRFICDDTEIAT